MQIAATALLLVILGSAPISTRGSIAHFPEVEGGLKWSQSIIFRQGMYNLEDAPIGIYDVVTPSVSWAYLAMFTPDPDTGSTSRFRASSSSTPHRSTTVARQTPVAIPTDDIGKGMNFLLYHHNDGAAIGPKIGPSNSRLSGSLSEQGVEDVDSSRGRSEDSLEWHVLENGLEFAFDDGSDEKTVLGRSSGSGSGGSGKLSVCCTPELAEAKGCGLSQVGEVVVLPESKELPRTAPIYSWFAHWGNDTENEDRTEFALPKTNITVTGMYYMRVTNCYLGGDIGVDGIAMDGSLVWRNPYGLIPGELWGVLVAYWILNYAYGLVGIVWLAQGTCLGKDFLRVQLFMLAVVVIGWLEAVIGVHRWEVFNDTGSFDWFSTLLISIANVGKRGSIRVLCLVLSHGFGVLVPALGSIDASRVRRFCVLWFPLAFLLELTQRAEDNTAKAGGGAMFILALPVAMLDAGFYYYTFLALTNTIEMTRARKQKAKMSLYKSFLGLLGFAVVTSGAFALFEMAYVYSDGADPDADGAWESWWLLRSFWHFLYFIFVVGALWLWRPGANDRRFSYDKLGDDAEAGGNGNLEMDDTAISVSTATDRGVMVTRSNKAKDSVALPYGAVKPSFSIDQADDDVDSDQEIVTKRD